MQMITIGLKYKSVQNQVFFIDTLPLPTLPLKEYILYRQFNIDSYGQSLRPRPTIE